MEPKSKPPSKPKPTAKKDAELPRNPMATPPRKKKEVELPRNPMAAPPRQVRATKPQPAAETPTAEAAPVVESPYLAEHTVVSGDNLYAIARKYYGADTNWKKIYEANKELIGDNPSLIRPGQLLRIPRV
jgi:nucleoid-associated protein YgaU